MINVGSIDRHFLRAPTIIEETEPKYRNIVRSHTFFSQNELRISDIVKTIPFYFLDFLVMREHKFVKIGKMNNITTETCESVTNERFLLCMYENCPIIAFNDFLYGLPTPTLVLKHIFETYSHLLASLTKLNNAGICFFNLSSETIKIRENFAPILTGFDKSLSINSLDEQYISEFIKNTRDYTYKPIEVHILFYLICRNESIISYSLADTICSNYVKHLPVLRFFSREQISVFETKTMQFIEQFINRRKSDIIIELLHSVNTWDNYSLSVMYLHLLGTFQRVFSLHTSVVMNNMIGMLFNNILIGKRSLISTTREKDVILGDFTEFELDLDRMDDLRTQLSS
jgi:hypothetical protein